MEMISILVLAVLIAIGLYTAIEWYETFAATRHSPRHSVSGPESAVGQRAIVCRDFEETVSGTLRGKVRFEGEEWRAEYAGTDAPAVGQSVIVTEMDAGGLMLKVR